MKTTKKILKNNQLIADQCKVAESFFQRLVGLIGKKELRQGEALLIPRCNSVHMWFMRFSIDVVFVKEGNKNANNREFRVVSTNSHLAPWKVLPVTHFGAQDTIEFPQGTVKQFGIQPGDVLCIS